MMPYKAATARPLSHLLLPQFAFPFPIQSAMLRRLCAAAILDRSTSNLRPMVAAASRHHFLLPFQKPYSRSSDKQSPVTVSFLTGSCGFPADAARSIAQRLQSRSVENAESVVALLKDYGFSEAQIVVLVARSPYLIILRPRSLKPKLEFYRGMGFVGDALTKVLAASPRVLLCSLRSRLLPNAEFLRSTLGSDERVVEALKNSPMLIAENFGRVVIPRIESLRGGGAGDDVIRLMLSKYGDVFLRRSTRLMEGVDEIKRMGVSPAKLTFGHALGVFVLFPQRLWNEKAGNLRCLGWSDDQIKAAFVRQPNIIMSSTEKIRRNITFVEEMLGWKAEYASTYPNVLSMNLEKRLMPRYAVLDVLISKGLLKTKLSAPKFVISEEKFLAKFVIPYKEKAPEIVDAYRGLKEEQLM